MAKPLVIVESPAKAKTIARFLGDDFVVESSIGHIRDLPKDAADVPEAFKTQPWSRIGVDTENDFKPLYVISREKKQQVAKLRALLKDADELYLATDEDREGESIAWHLLEVLGPKVPVKRMVFHEITKPAIQAAVNNWREVDRRLVNAQEARRILDRLYGYEVSPVLWRKVLPKLSAGRVQSVATRILVERERARMRFRSAAYWGLEATLEVDEAKVDVGQPTAFLAQVIAIDGTRLATGKDFTEDGRLNRQDLKLLDEQTAIGLVERLRGAPVETTSVEEKPFRRSPYPPFMTSTLQQEGGRKLRFSAGRTMQAAQRLYENGYITYMRTDSTALSEQALNAARAEARRLYGDAYVPETPRRYEKKVKNAQEAHEAIRPAGDAFQSPDAVAKQVSNDEAKIYELIWKRTVASQMADARGNSVHARFISRSNSGEVVELSASGKTITFPGFLRAYVEGADDPEAQLEDRDSPLPALAVHDSLNMAGVEAKGHATQPPARYTEASLVKALEEMGVGRPSTYASIISTIQDRGYVWKKGSALVPAFLAFSVVGLLEAHFPNLIDYGFTASMEDDLDEIAGGRKEEVPWLRHFYFGNGQSGLKTLVSSERLEEIDPRVVNSIPLGADPDGNEIVVRVGRYGPYLQRGEEHASIPPDVAPDELTIERALELIQTGKEEHVVGNDPQSGLAIMVKAGRFGPYVQVGEADVDGNERPRTASLFKTMSPSSITLDEALRLLSLPRSVGNHPADGEEIVALNGRYGPYLKKGTDSRSIDDEQLLFTITLEQAVAVFAEPKRGRGQRAASAPLRELGEDPNSGAKIVIKDGRFGAYLTDGQVNVTVPRDETIETISLERAVDLLADKRARGPVKKTSSKRSGAKSTAKKSAAKRAPVKKAPVKKVAVKKSATKVARTASGATQATRAKESTKAKPADDSAPAVPS